MSETIQLEKIGNEKSTAQVISTSEKERLEKNRQLREKLVKQIEHSDDIVFDEFSKSIKKHSRKKDVFIWIACIALIAVLGAFVYTGFFSRNDILRKNKIGDDYSSIVNRERFMYDSKDGETFTDTWLIYNDVHFLNYTGDVFYYFDEPNGKLLGASLKLDYSESCHDDVLKFMEKKYGDYKEEKYNSLIPNAFRWDKDGNVIRYLSSKETNVVEINIFAKE